jgi:hypothetical protein
MAPKSTLLDTMKAAHAAAASKRQADERVRKATKQREKEEAAARKKRERQEFLRSIGGVSTLRRWKRVDSFP